MLMMAVTLTLSPPTVLAMSPYTLVEATTLIPSAVLPAEGSGWGLHALSSRPSPARAARDVRAAERRTETSVQWLRDRKEPLKLIPK